MKTQITVRVWKYNEDFSRELVYLRVCTSKKEAFAVRDTAFYMMDSSMSVEMETA